MLDYLDFRRMITPAIVQVLFYISMALFVGVGVYLVADDAVLLGLALAILGPLVTRVILEVMVVMFKIHSALVAIEERVDDIWADMESET